MVDMAWSLWGVTRLGLTHAYRGYSERHTTSWEGEDIAVVGRTMTTSNLTQIEYRQSVANAMTEAELQSYILDACERLGVIWVWHDNDSRKNASGLPDLLILLPGRMLAWELKTEKAAKQMRTWEKLSASRRKITRYKIRLAVQLGTILRFRRAGVRARVVRPRDWLSGWVMRELLEGFEQ